jgi:hypothetical protein
MRSSKQVASTLVYLQPRLSLNTPIRIPLDKVRGDKRTSLPDCGKKVFFYINDLVYNKMWLIGICDERKKSFDIKIKDRVSPQQACAIKL